MYFAVTFVASLLVSTSALVTPHAGDSIYRRHQHASLARRAAAPDPAGQPLEASAAIPKRQLRKRCKPRKTSSALSATSAATSAASAPSNDPANVAPLPSSKPTTSHDAPSSSANPAPVPSPSPAPQPSPSSSAAPAPSSSSGNGGQSGSLFQGTHTGDGTYYATGLGACGFNNNDSQFIAAVSYILFDSFPNYDGKNPNKNPVCGKKVRVSYQGNSVDVEITDRCTGCASTALDFSPTAFNKLADPAVGRIHDITWTWL